MLLNKFLNEGSDIFNGSYNMEVPQPLSEASWITPDSVGLGMLKREDEAYDNKLSEAMIYANCLAEVAVAQGQDPSMLLEAAFGDFFSKLVKSLKDAWQRMVTWFKNLFKSISVSMIDVKKSLKDIEKILNKKDFRDFKYDGHEWIANGGGMPDKLGKVITGTIDDITKALDSRIKDIKNAHNSVPDDTNTSHKDTQDSASKEFENQDHTTELRKFNGELVGIRGKELSLEEAKDKIKEAYGYTKTFSDKTGLEWSPMVKFLREFENNKVLKDAQNKCNETYSEMVKKAEEAKKAAEAAQNDLKSDSAKYKNAKASLNGHIKFLTSYISLYKSRSSAYDSLMGTCIEMEKNRFSEYRGIIARAVRYSGKKEK